MFSLQTIASLELPELAPYRTLRRAAEHAAQGIFVAEGDKVVRRLLESDFGVLSVLLPASRVAEFEPLLRARPEVDIPVFAVTNKAVLEELVGFEMFQGVLAIGKIPAMATLETVLADQRRPRLFAAVDGLTSAENIGLLVRNCAAFGTQALIVGETSSSPFLRRAVRNSMGTIFQLPVVELKVEGRPPGPQPGGHPARAARPWHPLSGGPSPHGPEIFIAGGFYGRLLYCFRERRQRTFPGSAGRVRRGRGGAHGGGGGLPECRGGGGGVSVRGGAPAPGGLTRIFHSHFGKSREKPYEKRGANTCECVVEKTRQAGLETCDTAGWEACATRVCHGFAGFTMKYPG